MNWNSRSAEQRGHVMNKNLSLVLLCAFLPACETIGQLNEPRTLGEVNTGYNYIPVDPLQVGVLLETQFPAGTSASEMRRGRYGRCVPRRNDAAKVDVMDALPDHTVRMAVRSVSGKGSGGFGPVAVSARGGNYQVVVDSIFADTTNVRFAIRVGGGQTLMSLPENIPGGTDIEVIRLNANEGAAPGFEEVTIPVYVGVGLRLTANLFTRQGGINLSNLPAIAASVEGERSSGSLTMQTLGIYSQQVASTFPIPSELNTTSIQNALVSLGAVKAVVYDNDTGTRPRVTGIYNPLPTSDPELINRIYSALAKDPINWAPCGNS